MIGKVARKSSCDNDKVFFFNCFCFSYAIHPPLFSSQNRFHNAHTIEFNSNRGGINLETEKNADGTTSRLLLTRAQFRDGGNYTCVPHGAIPASGFVHVLNGECFAHKITMKSSPKFPLSCCTSLHQHSITLYSPLLLYIIHSLSICCRGLIA